MICVVYRLRAHQIWLPKCILPGDIHWVDSMIAGCWLLAVLNFRLYRLLLIQDMASLRMPGLDSWAGVPDLTSH